MSATAAIPVTIEPEAAARVAELGMQREFEEMLEHTKVAMPDTRAIEVTLGYDYEEEREPAIVIAPHRPEPTAGHDPPERAWTRWFVQRFPPHVCQHFVLLSTYELTDGR